MNSDQSHLQLRKHEFLKLVYVHVSLFEKLIDHNLIYDHDTFAIQEIINSGLLLIILSVLKLFIDDRNSFSSEQWKNLHQSISQTLPTTEESDISQINEKVKTDTLDITLITPPEKLTLPTPEKKNCIPRY